MAHSHDSTLLARFGFADPDRREPWHDVACQYLTQPDVLRQLALYREHFWVRSPRPGEAMPLTWMLATCYPLNAREAEALTVAGVLHVQLSPDRIMAWAASRDETPYVAPEV